MAGLKEFSFWALVLILSCLGSAQSQFKGKHVLLVMEKPAQKEEYTIFLDSLAEKGFHVDVVLSSDNTVALRKFGLYMFDHVVLMAPTVRQFSQSFGVKELLEFVDAGGNLLIAADTGFSSSIEELVQECGVDLDGDATRVHDHFSFAQGLEGSGIPDDDSTVVAADITRTQLILEDMDGLDPILFRGVATTIPQESDLVVSALLAPATAYSLEPKGKLAKVAEPAIGHEISMVSFVQAENNARVVVLGSIEMLSDTFFNARFKVWNTGRTHKQSGNKEFCMAVALWAFQHRGVLTVEEDGIRHWEINSKISPEMYRINDDIHFEIKILEERDGKQIPFRGADGAQLEYRMLDPYIRTDLQESEDGTWFAEFKAPDVYGVFKFEVHYRRAGYSYIDIVQQAPIRPYRHNEFDRFLVAAYPYYVSCLSMMLGFFMLGCFFLYK